MLKEVSPNDKKGEKEVSSNEKKGEKKDPSPKFEKKDPSPKNESKKSEKKPEKKVEIPKEEEPVQEVVESDSATSEELLEHVATANYIKKNQQIIKNSTNKRELTAIMEGEQNYNSKMQRSQKR